MKGKNKEQKREHKLENLRNLRKSKGKTKTLKNSPFAKALNYSDSEGSCKGCSNNNPYFHRRKTQRFPEESPPGCGGGSMQSRVQSQRIPASCDHPKRDHRPASVAEVAAALLLPSEFKNK